MKAVWVLFAIICIFYPRMSVQIEHQENIEAIQIVKNTGNYSFEYVPDNKLETILNSDDIKDRNVVVVSIVGGIQTGKSLMLNFFLNYLRVKYNISGRLTNPYAPDHWMDMNIKNGFDTKMNRNGTTKGIWAWPEIFTHDDIDGGKKVAIILLDTEGLYNPNKDLRHNTKIFALSTLFSSMQGYSSIQIVGSDTLQLLDVFTSYTVFGARMIHSSNTTEVPFQNLRFIVRDSKYSDQSEDDNLNHIFSKDVADQNRGIKERLKKAFKTIRVSELPYPGKKVDRDSFDGNTAQFDQDFRDKMNETVTEMLKPENIIIKEINGQLVTAKLFSIFLKTFTNVVENNVTAPTNLVEVLANASNCILNDKFLQLYNDSMYAELHAVANALKPYYEKDELVEKHREHRNESIIQFRNLVKYGGDEFSVPFEKLLSDKIDDCFENIKRVNEFMRLDFEKQTMAEAAFNSMWLWIGAPICVAFIGILYCLFRVRSQNEQNEQCEEADVDFVAEKTEKMLAFESEKQ